MKYHMSVFTWDQYDEVGRANVDAHMAEWADDGWELVAVHQKDHEQGRTARITQFFYWKHE
jgi:hypothetical protein